MNSFNDTRAKALPEPELMDLVRAGVILAITVAAALIVPPKVFGALQAQTVVATTSARAVP